MARRRFIVDKFGAERTILTGEQAHHLAHVLRVRPGQLYELSDQQTVWLARVTRVAPKQVAFELVEPVSVSASIPRLILLAAIVKFARFEWLLEKATELGVSEIIPVAAERSDRHLIGAANRRRTRWEKLLKAAAEQARRAEVPRLGPLRKFSEVLPAVDCVVQILFSEDPDAPPLRRLLRAALPASSAALAVGPEGGWTHEERQIARQMGFAEASLGCNILRTETAALTALAILRYELAPD